MYCILSCAKAFETAVYLAAVFFSYRGTPAWVSLSGAFWWGFLWFVCMVLWLWLWFGVIGLLRRRTAAFLLLVGNGDCHSPSWLTGAYSGSGLFLKIVGLASGFSLVWSMGYHFLGEVLVNTDFLLDLEFYARMILISILGLYTENCFQFSRYVYFNIHI